tara:strand:- start:80479 stop:80634 length:156 start_codon:yes stop_codon:yes gene_type:complete
MGLLQFSELKQTENLVWFLLGKIGNRGSGRHFRANNSLSVLKFSVRLQFVG